MEPSDLSRHQLIENLMAKKNGKLVDSAIILWEKLATQVISIVGEEGFCSLYARSVFLAQSTLSWCVVSPQLSQGEYRFAELKINLESQTSAQVIAVNSLLLITFTDILASLIGEQMTNNILRSAWRTHTPNWRG